ncbi:Phospholipase_D-nuclease N-terminal [Paenibacillus uliginis N3/975]|uniref:Phospholipase_D-nuclease N-terminal n=1 Tax=Paenibacillus uliginis N3/975 TaxID=1313296 RepID=A0A1X7GKM0_9BACL|nr:MULTISPECIES: PLDc N-terminal domain-containing protein [Paenibacillus]UNK17781.1 PLDc N-terminal domain-containing protein [Paenibacillus sp. N3/727]SMF71244.1 Phospholipase_D-nuclease N-terminal [Paenibacillus uliginis N3/975]
MDINWGLIWPLIGLQIILAVTALISLYKAEPEDIRGSKLMWVFIILLISIFGSVAYFVAGRKNT